MFLAPLLLALAAQAAEPPAITRTPVEVEVVTTDDAGLAPAIAERRREVEAVMREHAVRLAARGSARDLLSAALLWPTPNARPTDHPHPAKAWFAAARAAVPGEPLVDWIEATGCAGLADPCDQEAAIARLLAGDDGNAAVHVLAMNAAARRGDDDAVAFHLRKAATARRFEPMEPRLQALLLDAYAGIDWPDERPAMAAHAVAMRGSAAPVPDAETSVLLALAQALPLASRSHFSIGKACRDTQAATEPGRHADCMALLTAMAEEDGASHRLFALAELSRLTAGDSRGDHWREQLRQAMWVLERSSSVMDQAMFRGVDMLDFAALLVERGEIAAMRELMRKDGIPGEPSADWLPATAESRALVTTGTVPAQGGRQ